MLFQVYKFDYVYSWLQKTFVFGDFEIVLSDF